MFSFRLLRLKIRSRQSLNEENIGGREVPCAPMIELLLVEELSPFVFGDVFSELRVLQQL